MKDGKRFKVFKVKDCSCRLYIDFPKTDKESVWIDSLVTQRESQNKGYATRLLKIITRWARIFKLKVALMANSAANWMGGLDQERLVQFYKKFGFTEDPTYKPSPYATRMVFNP